MFDHLADRLRSAPFLNVPFRHLYIDNFFTDADFARLIASPSIDLGRNSSDKELIDSLHAAHFKEIEFPGATTNLDDYLSWHSKPDRKTHGNFDMCEGFGATFRLQKSDDDFVSELIAFLKSDTWSSAMAEKFGIERSEVSPDSGIQKYLDGYEISPHPDVRKKALTFMVNINPAEHSSGLNFHTHYMKLRPERRYVQTYWEGNPDRDRCWLPWDWCETISVQRANNSIVLFRPGDDTLHAVRARYNHLLTQRTQLYGNLWYDNAPPLPKPTWRDFEIGITPERVANKPG